MSTGSACQNIARDTQSKTPGILEANGTSRESILYRELLPNLSAGESGSTHKSRVEVQNADSFTAAQHLQQHHPASRDRIGVSYMESELHPGGGWLSDALAQEALCLRSTLAGSLDGGMYPLPEIGAIWTPNVVVFRDEVGRECRVYEAGERFRVGVVSVAGVRVPTVRARERDGGKEYGDEGDARVMRDKIRHVGQTWHHALCIRCVEMWCVWESAGTRGADVQGGSG